jgi:hypothetical protein
VRGRGDPPGEAEPDDGVLTGGVGHGRAETTEEPGQRSRVHAASDRLADHVGVGGMATVHDPREVHIDGPLPVVEVDVLDRERRTDPPVVAHVVQSVRAGRGSHRPERERPSHRRRRVARPPPRSRAGLQPRLRRRRRCPRARRRTLGPPVGGQERARSQTPPGHDRGASHPHPTPPATMVRPNSGTVADLA